MTLYKKTAAVRPTCPHLKSNNEFDNCHSDLMKAWQKNVLFVLQLHSTEC